MLCLIYLRLKTHSNGYNLSHLSDINNTSGSGNKLFPTKSNSTSYSVKPPRHNVFQSSGK